MIMKTNSSRHTVRTSRAHWILSAYAGLALIAAGNLQAANVPTIWDVTDGDWLTAGNWSAGLPADLAPADLSQALFNVTANSPETSNVTLNGVGTFDYLGVGLGKTVNLELGDGASLTGKTIIVGRFVAGTVVSSHLNVTGPATGQANLTWSSGFQLGGVATGLGDTATFSGPNLTITDTAANLTVGRQGNGHTLTIKDGVKYSGKAMIVSATVNVTSGVGNNHKLVVSGTGTEVSLGGQTGSTATLGLIVGSRPLTGSSSSNVQSGNAVEISNGARMTVVGDNPDATMTVLVGASTYRVNNSIQVAGANSVLDLKGDIATTIGHTTDTSYNNRLVVNNGGTIRSEGVININNGTSIAANRRNILDVGSLGTLLTSNAINNNGGLVRLNEGGVLRGETSFGASTAVALNINGTGRFEAAGSGLGSTVAVNVGNGASQAVLAVGITGRTFAATWTVDSAISMNNNSALEVSIFGSHSIDSIILGENSSFTIGENVTLSIGLRNHVLQAGDSYQLFSGEFDHVIGNFSTISTPTLAGDLSWDLSGFNADGGWTVAVIPEPSSMVLLFGGGAVAMMLRRMRSKR